MKPRPLVSTFALCARGNSMGVGMRLRPAFRAGSLNLGNCRTEQENGRGRWASTTSTSAAKPGHNMVMTKKHKGSNTTTVLAKTSNTTPTAPPPSVPVLRAKSNLNPPLFTYAPDLQIPARKHDQSFIGHLWTTGRTYISFYKAGISHVRQTASLAKTLRAKVSSANKPAVEVLTRAEWQIIRRSKADMIRLPGFGLLVLLLGEWLPLVVLYMTPLIPEPCRIPQQVARTLAKAQQRRHTRLRDVSRRGMALQAKDRRTPGATTDDSLYELVLKSARFGCHSPAWDVLGLTPPKWLLRRSVGRTVDYIRTDDGLVERDGGWAACERREVERACAERGIDVLGKKEDELRREIVEWSWNRRF